MTGKRGLVAISLHSDRLPASYPPMVAESREQPAASRRSEAIAPGTTIGQGVFDLHEPKGGLNEMGSTAQDPCVKPKTFAFPLASFLVLKVQ
jgi:hypothetical protein